MQNSIIASLSKLANGTTNLSQQDLLLLAQLLESDDTLLLKYMEQSIGEMIYEGKRTMHLYEAAQKEINTKLEILDGEFHALYDHNPIHHMEHRLKSVRSILLKMQRKGVSMSIAAMQEQITDIAGIRVICNYQEDIYQLSEMLLAQDDIHLLKQSDYIKSPKANGYRSLHLIIEVPVFLSTNVTYVPVELQIRTIAMDMWASLEHELYYKGSKKHAGNEALQRELKECAEVLSDIDKKMQSIYKRLTPEEENAHAV
ncbi:MAG: GTP pyrophosphokinase [Christensenellaceae bacterium]|jgi:putative GTP pyrophosphokinase